MTIEKLPEGLNPGFRYAVGMALFCLLFVVPGILIENGPMIFVAIVLGGAFGIQAVRMVRRARLAKRLNADPELLGIYQSWSRDD